MPFGHWSWDDFVVDQLLELPDGQVELPGGGRLALVATDDDYASAVECRDADGSLRWQALPPEGQPDAWVAVRLQDHTVTANSWSGWLVCIDIDTGVVIERHFTK